MTQNATNASIADLFPGRQVVLAPTLTVTVYPVGVCHLPRFMTKIQSATQSIIKLLGSKAAPLIDGKLNEESVKKAMKDMLPLLVPIIVTDLFDLVAECVTGVDLRDPRLPHWVLPAVVEPWLEESFLKDPDKQLRPWVTAVEALLGRLLPKAGSLKLWDSLSEAFSSQVTPVTTS